VWKIFLIFMREYFGSLILFTGYGHTLASAHRLPSLHDLALQKDPVNPQKSSSEFLEKEV